MSEKAYTSKERFDIIHKGLEELSKELL